eukprot:4552639-Alexandrium_andersonii.AAC.1
MCHGYKMNLPLCRKLCRKLCPSHRPTPRNSCAKLNTARCHHDANARRMPALPDMTRSHELALSTHTQCVCNQRSL